MDSPAYNRIDFG